MDPQEERPVFVIGRQHSGNTMLTRMLGRHDQLHAFSGEGTFFERQSEIQAAPIEERPHRVAREMSGGDLALEDVLHYIRQRVEDRPQPLDQYLAGKRGIAEQHGATRWVQKATSYVFHASDILERLPRAQFLFLSRNPLDLAASLKRRGAKVRWGRMVWGWNRGTRKAHLIKRRYPKKLRVRRPISGRLFWIF